MNNYFEVVVGFLLFLIKKVDEGASGDKERKFCLSLLFLFFNQRRSSSLNFVIGTGRALIGRRFTFAVFFSVSSSSDDCRSPNAFAQHQLAARVSTSGSEAPRRHCHLPATMTESELWY